MTISRHRTRASNGLPAAAGSARDTPRSALTHGRARLRWRAGVLAAVRGALLGALVPVAAAGQIRTMPTAVCRDPLPVTEIGGGVFIDDLTQFYNAGRRDELLTRAAMLLARVAAVYGQTGCPGEPASVGQLRQLLDAKAHYIALTWVGADGLSGRAAVMRVVVHDDGPGGAVRNADAALPGIGAGADGPRLVEVFIGRHRDAAASSVYTSTRERDPTETQAPAFVRAIAGPIFAIIGALAGDSLQGVTQAQRVRASRAQPIWATISGVRLPHARAAVRVQVSARDAVDGAAFAAGLGALAAATAYKEAAHSPCARAYARTLETTVAGAIGEEACASDQPARACAARLDALMLAAYDGADACRQSRDDAAALAAVDRRFRTVVLSESVAAAELTYVFHNRPLAHVAFGAGAAVVGWAKSSRPRVTLNDAGTIVADPLPRVLTTAFVNWSPRGYDGTAPEMSRAERYRVFAGAALTPDFGIVGGLNALVARGIGVSAGIGVLFGTGAPEEEIGGPPADATNPFRLAVVPMVFVGISYNFK